MPSDSAMADDRRWMYKALELAQLGLGRVEPNPMVGCVLVKDGRLIAEGYHPYYGGPHAERAAVQQALQTGKADQLAGCTAYVTLEPCCHHGKTPPCSDLLVESGVARVVVASLDPFTQVSGKGVQQLREAGIRVDVGVLQPEAEELNAAYFKRILQGHPWVIAKWAMSLDGRIATSTGNSQWISGDLSRQKVHRLRSRVDAIVVGSRTALADDPLLTARCGDGEAPHRVAQRVVIDSRLAIRCESQLAQTANQYPTLIWSGPEADAEKAKALRSLGCRVEISSHPLPKDRLEQLLRFLVDEHGATNILVEGGGGILGALFDLKQIDECHVFIAPKIIGGQKAVSPIAGLGIPTIAEGPQCTNVHFEPSGDDVYCQCRVNWQSSGG
jgi:diaminohydroxyphosphoribosylaminopyrimidine deaminase / 5-amino-6-(5-phosphoribosylamino)uracil reductase